LASDLALTGRYEEQTVDFCSYCGQFSDDGQRVCSDCGLGVRLHTDAAVLRSPGAAFLVVRGDGRVSAASAAAERMLSGHGDVVGRPLLTLLSAPSSEGALSHAVAVAATGQPGVSEFTVDLVGGGRGTRDLQASVAPCGLPPAALIVLERPLHVP
jgi:hypothetical protein